MFACHNKLLCLLMTNKDVLVLHVIISFVDDLYLSASLRCCGNNELVSLLMTYKDMLV
jgi:hypothetical protein